MLIVFTVSITPTIIFHDLFATHTDSVTKSANANQEHVGKKIFNCHCDNIVAESPFTETPVFIIQTTQHFFAIVNADLAVQFSSTLHISYSQRGPPVV